MKNRVVHFDVPVDDPDRAIKFYSDVFGWKIEKWDGPMDYWLVMTGDEKEPGGINGGMMMRKDGHVGASDISIGVDSVDDYMEKVKEHGGEIPMGKEAIPGVGYMATFKDTEGNVYGLYQEDMSAK